MFSSNSISKASSPSNTVSSPATTRPAPRRSQTYPNDLQHIMEVPNSNQFTSRHTSIAPTNRSASTGSLRRSTTAPIPIIRNAQNRHNRLDDESASIEQTKIVMDLKTWAMYFLIKDHRDKKNAEKSSSQPEFLETSTDPAVIGSITDIVSLDPHIFYIKEIAPPPPSISGENHLDHVDLEKEKSLTNRTLDEDMPFPMSL